LELEGAQWNSVLSRTLQRFSEFFSTVANFGGDVTDHHMADGYIASIHARPAGRDALPSR